jgi:hypothetical protein
MSRRTPHARPAPALLFAAALCLFVPATARQEQPAQPVFHDFKGVAIGMSAAEARQKLGAPTDKSDALDLYDIADRQTVQVFYESGKVAAVAVVFMKPDADAPPPKAVVGSDVEAGADGSLYKMVRYPKAGYWVSYSRIPGANPLVTITMRKL